MKNYALGASLLTAILCAGCENGNLTLTDAARATEKAKVHKRGEARKELFVECMKLAAKIPRQADDDVSDIVVECTISSYYVTNFIE